MFTTHYIHIYDTKLIKLHSIKTTLETEFLFKICEFGKVIS